MSLDKITAFIGIDVSKYWFHVYVMRAVYPPLEFRCENTEGGVYAFLTRLRFHRISNSQSTIVTLEHTGLYTNILIDILSKEHLLLVVEMAARIRKGLGITRGKKDEIDCKRIAEYTMRHLDNLYLYIPKPKKLDTIKILLQNRNRLLRAKGQLQTPLKEARYLRVADQQFYSGFNKDVLNSIDEAIENIMTEIYQIVAGNAKILRQYELLLSVPGIGPYVALELMVHTNCFSNCDSLAQLSSYCGVAPFEISSGIAIPRAHTSKMSNRILKGLLFLGALGQVRAHNELRDYYERKVKEGKPKKLVLNNVSNKILHRVWAVIKRDSVYMPREIHRQKFMSVAGLS